MAGVSVLAAVAAGLLYTQLDNELVPDEDRGVIEVDAVGPDGVGLDFMDRELDEVETVLEPYIESGEIESTFSIVGRYDPNRVRVTAELADWSERERSQTEIVEALSDPLRDIPGSRVSARGRGTLSFGGGGEGIQIALTGAEYEGIFRSAQALAEAIDTQSSILSNAEVSYQPTQPQLSIRIDRQRAFETGLQFPESGHQIAEAGMAEMSDSPVSPLL